MTGRNGRSSREHQGIIAYCTCQWNRIDYVNSSHETKCLSQGPIKQSTMLILYCRTARMLNLREWMHSSWRTVVVEGLLNAHPLYLI
jgi:hypothetical protein